MKTIIKIWTERQYRSIIYAFLGVLFITLYLLFTSPVYSQATDSGNNGTKPSQWYEIKMMADPIYDQILLFYLAMTYSGQADIGECLETASRVDLDDPDSWPHEWTATAERLQTLATSAETNGHTVSAGQLYMRSATYYSAALHRHNDPKALMVVKNARAASASFRKALKLLKLPAESVRIPYGDTTLPGYFFRSPLVKGPAPVLIVHQGRDAWAFHCKYIADAAVKRGYHCLLFDGPGQGETLRLQGLTFRHDWENVITPVVDYLVSQKEVDPERIGLVGISFGGSLAPRAAAFEKRIKVCVANPGAISWPDIVYGFMGEIDPSLATHWQSNPDEFNTRIATLATQVPLIDWSIKDQMWKHGSNSPAHMMAQMQDYSNREIVSKITCRMLLMDGTADDFWQARELFEALDCPKEYMLFTAEDTGLLHCQVGAQAISSERLFDWLDENL